MNDYYYTMLILNLIISSFSRLPELLLLYQWSWCVVLSLSIPNSVSDHGYILPYIQSIILPDFLHSLKILSQFCVQTSCRQLIVLSVPEISLSIQEPKGDVVCLRITDHLSHLLSLSLSQITWSSVGVDSQDLKNTNQSPHALLCRSNLRIFFQYPWSIWFRKSPLPYPPR